MEISFEGIKTMCCESDELKITDENGKVATLRGMIQVIHLKNMVDIYVAKKFIKNKGQGHETNSRN